MNRRQILVTVFCAAVWLSFAATPASAQSTPSLAGTWKLNFDKSGDRIAGNGAAVPFSSEMVITQSPTELSVERTSVRQAPFKAVYKLDGSRVTVSAPAGISETAEAKFDGAMLIIASRWVVTNLPPLNAGAWVRPTALASGAPCPSRPWHE